MPQIQLFSYPTSPYAQKVGCYLKFKQLDFKLVPVNPLTNHEIAFTQQRQVPVLQIGEQWRKESSEIGIWLDEQFPDKPLLPQDPSARSAILEIDSWISNSLIPGGFRYAVEWQNPWYSVRNGWRLSRAVSNATPLAWHIRLIWPFGVKRAPFIVNMVEQLDLSETLPDMNARLQNEFVNHLQGGPFLGSESSPTLADLSAFPVIASGRFMGMQVKQAVIEHQAILEWAQRVHASLPTNPLLVPARLLKRTSL